MISQNYSEQKQNDEKCYPFLENFMPWDQNIPLKTDVSSPSGNTAKLCIKVAMYEKNFLVINIKYGQSKKISF